MNEFILKKKQRKKKRVTAFNKLSLRVFYQRGSADLVLVSAALTLISLSIADAMDETISISLPSGS